MILVIVALIVLAMTRVYLVMPKRNRAHIQSKSQRTKPCKTCIFLGSGNADKKQMKAARFIIKY